MFDALVALHWKSVHNETRQWFGNEWAARVPTRAIWESGKLTQGWRIIAQKRIPAALAFESLHHGVARTIGDALGISGTTDLLEQAAGTVGVQLVDSDENRKRRIWRESRPVLHLAVALHPVLTDYSTRDTGTDWSDLLEHPQWVPAACRNAATVLPILARPPVSLLTSEAWPVDSICKFRP